MKRLVNPRSGKEQEMNDTAIEDAEPVRAPYSPPALADLGSAAEITAGLPINNGMDAAIYS